MTKKEEVKAKIQELVSEIMELKFGCEVLHHEKKLVIIRKNKGYGEFVAQEVGAETNQTWSLEPHNYEILGRPIQLADVLLAIGDDIGLEALCQLLHKWDLAQPYDNQPEEVYEFLHNILID